MIDMTGRQFGKWTVLERAGNDKHSNDRWKCVCDCGTEKIVIGYNIRNGSSTKCKSCAMKSRIYSDEAKLKMSENHANFKGRNNPMFGRTGEKHPFYGKHHSEEFRKKMSESQKGEKHPNWNPNLTDEERQDKRNYPAYYDWRQSVYERDNYTCQCCGKKGRTLNTHHLESYAGNKDLRTTLENGITLCKTCHKNFHHQYGYGCNTKEQYLEYKGEQL